MAQTSACMVMFATQRKKSEGTLTRAFTNLKSNTMKNTRAKVLTISETEQTINAVLTILL